MRARLRCAYLPLAAALGRAVVERVGDLAHYPESREAHEARVEDDGSQVGVPSKATGAGPRFSRLTLPGDRAHNPCMNIHTLVRGVGALALIVGTGCGGDDGATCADFMACGGDVVGSWSLQTMCGTGTFDDDECKGATMEMNGVNYTGTVTFNGDKTYSTDAMMSGHATMHMPSSCLTFGGVKVTCEQLNMALMSQLKMNEVFSGITCSTEAVGCACKVTFKPQSLKETGRYSTSGNTITVTTASGNGEADDYCVSGSTLRMKPSKMMGMMSMSDFVGRVTAKKK